MLFGAIGATVWAAADGSGSDHAAGSSTASAHWWGYRNFEATDASRNRLAVGH
jgi:stearoyl-CoA desaturase (delta-9 desaturase)